MAKVKPLEIQPDKECQCGSWLNHWKTFSHQYIRCCVEATCTDNNLIGTHVQRTDPDDTRTYVVPLCKKHSESKEVIEVSDHCKLISANVKKTCGYGSYVLMEANIL